MTFSYFVLVVVSAIFFCSEVTAQIHFDKTNQRVVVLDQRQGLSQSSVNSLAQDKLGYVWAATQSGLNRYDGDSFRQFFSDNEGLAGNFISNICDDATRDMLWIGTKSGLSVYDYKHDTLRNILKSDNPNIPSDVISRVSCSINGVYVGTQQDGIYFIDATTGDILVNDEISNTRIHQLSSDSSGVYMATASGIYHWNALNNITNMLSNSKANSILIDGNMLLFFTPIDDRVYAKRVAGQQLENGWDIGLSDGTNIMVSDMLRVNERYVLSTSFGLVEMSTEGQSLQWLQHNPLSEDSLSDNHIITSLLDRAGALWLGTQSGGINYLNLQGVKFGHVNRYTYPESPLSNDIMSSISVDENNTLWLGTAEGTFVFKDNQFTRLGERFPVLAKYDGAYVSQAVVIKNTLWLITLSDGIVAFNLETKQPKSYYNDTNNVTWLFNYIVEYDGKLIVSTRSNGLLAYDAGEDKFVPYLADHSNMTKVPYSLLVLGNALWFSSLGDGIFRYKDNILQKMDKIEGEPRQRFYMLDADNLGRVWATSANGVAIIDNNFEVIQEIKKGDGLNSDAVWSVVNDRQGAMWLGTSGGLTRVDQQNYEITNFSLLDGIQGLEYNVGAATISPSGRVFIGGSRGFNQFMPSDIQGFYDQPIILLNQVKVVGKSLKDQNVAVEHLKQLNLSYQQDILSFNYTALNFSRRAIDFYYKIDGLSSQWLKLDRGNSQINLMKVPPGKYQLAVYAQDDKNRRSTTAVLAFSISPPWWWSTVSKLFYTLSFLSLLIVFIYLKRRAYRHLETVVLQRTRQLSTKNNRLNDTLTKLQQAQDSLVESEKMASLGAVVAGVAHEINTPLGIVMTGVSYNRDALDDIQTQLQQKTLTQAALTNSMTAQQESYTLIWRNLSRAIELVANFKKVAVDQNSETTRHINVKEYISDVISAIASSFRRRSVTIGVSGDDNITTTTYPGPLYQIITNLVNNSLNHGFISDKQGHIEIEISRSNSHFYICYRDDGCGIAADILSEIYEPFMTTRRHAGGSGLGMHIVYNLVTQVFRGQIKCTSTVGDGVTFTLTLPFETG